MEGGNDIELYLRPSSLFAMRPPHTGLKGNQKLTKNIDIVIRDIFRFR